MAWSTPAKEHFMNHTRVRFTRLAAAAAVCAGTLGVAAVPAPAGASGGITVLTARLNGANEIPGPGDDDGRGVALVVVDTETDTVCALLAVRRIDLPAAAAHIHTGRRTEAGPVLVGLNAPDASGLSATCVATEAADAIAARPRAYYVNVHTATYPGGAVRGQLHR
jgi:CHRD domain